MGNEYSVDTPSTDAPVDPSAEPSAETAAETMDEGVLGGEKPLSTEDETEEAISGSPSPTAMNMSVCSRLAGRKSRRSDEEASTKTFTLLQCRSLNALLQTHRARQFTIVDDDVVGMAVMKSQLKKRGFKVRTVSNAVEWMAHGAHVDASKDNIVMVDLNLPGTDGREIAKRLRENHPELVLLAVTNTRPQDTGVLFTLFDGVLLKPLSSQMLDALVGSLSPQPPASQ